MPGFTGTGSLKWSISGPAISQFFDSHIMAKVLVADDEVTMVQMISELLRKDGHEVVSYTNGPAALAGIESDAPDLVITDLYLDKNRAHGMEIVQKACTLNSPAMSIMITGF